MFIEVTLFDGKIKTLVNTNHISSIQPFIDNGVVKGCYINMANEFLKVIETMEILECLIEVNSIQKKINSIKDETTRIKLEQIYNKDFEKFISTN